MPVAVCFDYLITQTALRLHNVPHTLQGEIIDAPLPIIVFAIGQSAGDIRLLQQKLKMAPQHDKIVRFFGYFIIVYCDIYVKIDF